MIFPNYKKSCDHEGNRTKICLFCGHKSKKMFPITENLEKKLNSLVGTNLKDDRLPSVLCPSCRVYVYKGLNQKGSISLEKSIKNFLLRRRDTRSQSLNDVCKCYLCNLVRKNQINSEEKIVDSQTKDFELRRCLRCCTPIGKGISHRCHSQTLLNNLEKNVFKSEKVKQHATVDFLKSVSSEDRSKNSSASIRNDQKIVLSQKRGKPLEVVLKPNKKLKSSVISVTTMEKIQRNLNLSDRKLYGLAAAIHSETENSVKFEKNFKNKINENSHVLDDLFEVCDFDFVKENQNKISSVPGKGVICKDLKRLIDFVTEKRDLREVHIKFGIDGGGGFLKFCMLVQLINNILNDEIKQEFKKKKVYEKKLSDSGVKKLFIVFIAPGVQENYTNISIIWKQLKLNDCLQNGTIASDLKVVNLICGLMSSACAHPCPYCDAASSNLKVCGNSRTVFNCKTNFEEWQKSKKFSRKTAKNFNNCVNLPLLPEENKKILFFIPPPQLHLLLGATNTIFDKMCVENETVSLEWAKKCNASRKSTEGNFASFVGNDCDKLLKNIDCLESMKCFELCKYVEVLRKLKKVVNGCFSVNLDPQYKEYIQSLKKSYLELGISITPKMHIIFEHISEFCDHSNQGI